MDEALWSLFSYRLSGIFVLWYDLLDWGSGSESPSPLQATLSLAVEFNLMRN